MKNLNQSNFNIKVEREVEKKAVVLAVVAISLALGLIFSVFLYTLVVGIDMTQNIVLAIVTPIVVIWLGLRVYLGVVFKSNLEISLGKSIGYNKAQMERVLKNPNYVEHTGDW